MKNELLVLIINEPKIRATLYLACVENNLYCSVTSTELDVFVRKSEYKELCRVINDMSEYKEVILHALTDTVNYALNERGE